MRLCEGFFPCRRFFLLVQVENQARVSRWNRNWIPLIPIEDWWKTLTCHSLSSDSLLQKHRLWVLHHNFLSVPDPWLLATFDPASNWPQRSIHCSMVSFLHRLFTLHFWISGFPFIGILWMFEMRVVVLCQVLISPSQETEIKRKVDRSSLI